MKTYSAKQEQFKDLGTLTATEISDYIIKAASIDSTTKQVISGDSIFIKMK